MSQPGITTSLCPYINTSLCYFVTTSIRHYVHTSLRPYITMLLRSYVPTSLRPHITTSLPASLRPYVTTYIRHYVPTLLRPYVTTSLHVRSNINVRGVPRIWQGGPRIFFQIWKFACAAHGEDMRFTRGFGGMLPQDNFLKLCNLVHFGVYFDQILSLKIFKNYLFYLKILKIAILYMKE